MSGCTPPDVPEDCEYFEPANFDNDWSPPEEGEYDPGPDADIWGRAGFTVITIGEEISRCCEESDG
jgi:hypothetical protein